MESQILECECGNCHWLDCKNVIVSDRAYKKLIDATIKSEYKKIVVLNSLEQTVYVDRLVKALAQTDKELIIVNLPKCNAFLNLAETIEDKGQELVIAIGSEELISIAKYYSYCYSCPLYIYPLGNFVDYTFSKYSRLYDGVCYDFYACNQPEQIFVSSLANKYNKYQSSYIVSKYLAFFDNVATSVVFEQKGCQRMYDFFKNTLQEYMKGQSKEPNISNSKNIWLLIRIGFAMTFYEQTNVFLGADYYITTFIQSIYKKTDFLEINTISQKLLINSYSCFMGQLPSLYDFNLNKHIKAGSDLLKITATEVMNRMTEGIKLEKINISNFNNHFIYLKDVYTKTISKVFKLNSAFCLNENIMYKYKLDCVKLEKCFAVGSCFCRKKGLYTLLLNYGYLDKLL